MRHTFRVIVLLAFCGAAMAQKIQTRPPANEPVQAVIDDDGGRAFILNTKLKSLTELRRRPGAVISEPQQYSIFLGSHWSSTGLREREPKLGNLLSSNRSQAEIDKLDSFGIKNLFGATFSQEVFTNFAAEEKISDLGIRSILAQQVNAGSVPKTGASAIYMIFLEPGLRSTLGTLEGRKHYLAYHNFFNIAGRRLHYVVIPYEPDLETAKVIALQALVAAAVNPLGEPGN